MLGRTTAAGAVLATVLLGLVPGAASARDVEYAGTLSLQIADDFARDRSREEIVLDRGAESVLVEAPGARELIGRSVVVSGELEGDTVTGEVDPAPVVPPVRAATPGDRSVAVILVTFADDRRRTFTREQVSKRLFEDGDGLDAFYRTQSRQQAGVTGEVFDWVDAPESIGSCDSRAMASAAERAHDAAGGRDLGDFDHVAYFFPTDRRTTAEGDPLRGRCDYGGLGTLGSSSYGPGREMWINGYLSPRIFAHELGHNLGIHHAQSVRCPTPGSEDCALVDEYGDPFDVMGRSLRLMSSANRVRLGHVPRPDRVRAASGGTQRIELASANAAAGVRSVVVPRKQTAVSPTDGFYALELRSPLPPFDPFGATEPAATGVTVRLAGAVDVTTTTQLVDLHDGTAGFGDAPLQPADPPFVDAEHGVTIDVVSVEAGVATLDVTAPDLPDRAPPSKATLTASPSADQVSLTWGTSFDDEELARYDLVRDGVVLTSSQTPTTFNDATASPGRTYRYTVVAYDAAGNARSSDAVRSGLVGPDTFAPSAPSGLVASLQDGRVRLEWNEATDDRGAIGGYAIRRDGLFEGSVGGQETIYLSAPVAPGSTHTYSVAAADEAGNPGPTSNEVVVRVPIEAAAAAAAPPAAAEPAPAPRPLDPPAVRPIAPVDAAAPALRIASPALRRGTGRLPRSRTLLVRTTDAGGIARVSATLDRRPAGSTRSTTWRLRLPARAARGTHRLDLAARDRAGNVGRLRITIRSGRITVG